MTSGFREAVTGLVNRGRERFRRGISTRGAIGVSIILHLFIAMAFASFLAGRYYVEQAADTSPIVLDLATDSQVKFQEQNVNDDLSNPSKGFNLPNEIVNDGFNGEAESAEGSPSSTAASQRNNEAVVTASLASLSDLKESFKFVMHQVSSDSTNGFAPVQGKAPDTSVLTAGNGEGQGLGNGSGVSISFGGGGGHCPTPGIFQ